MKYTIVYQTDNFVKMETDEGQDYPIEDRLFENYDYQKDTLDEEGQYEYGYPIEIDKMIEYLKEIKAAGCNFVSMEYHDDHLSYLLQGVKVDWKVGKTLSQKEKDDLKEKIDLTDVQINQAKASLKHYKTKKAELEKLLK